MGLILQIIAIDAHGIEAFEACTGTNKTEINKIEANLACEATDSNFQQLLNIQTKAHTDLGLQLDKSRLGSYAAFSRTLRAKILENLKKKKTELEAISSCRPSGFDSFDECSRSLSTYRRHIRQAWPDLIDNLSLAYPRDINPHMFNSKVSWFDTHPRHPFEKRAEIPPLTHVERDRLEREFLLRLTKEVPEIAPYLARNKQEVRLLTEDPKHEALIRIAMVKIRDEAKQRYIEIVRKNPLLTFVGAVAHDEPNSPSDQSLQDAIKYLKSEVEREIVLIESGNVESERRLLKYRNLANEVLANSPRWCSAALVASKVAAEEEGSAQLKEAAMFVGASVLTLATCSSLILCGAAGAALGAIDYKITIDKSRDAFSEGVVDSSVGQSSQAILRSAEHRSEAGASLAVSAVGALSSGATLLKETGRVTGKVALHTTTTNRARREVSRMRTSAEIKNAGWLPASAHEMAAYSRLHISEVQSQAQRLFEKHAKLFPSLSLSKLKLLKQHDQEKVLDFGTLRSRHGYRGIPSDILRDHKDFSTFVPRQSADRKYIEMSLNEALELLWGQNPSSLAKHAQTARSQAEFAHWKAMDKLRDYVIENLNRIDTEIMEESMRRLRSPQERVEMRLIEFLSDLTARKSNPLTQHEFGREISSTSEFIRKMGKENLVSKLAGGSDSPMEIHAARRLLDRVSVDELADIAAWLEAK